ncbi:MAG: type II secretion system protein [Candidatus Berkelbacteria bacterium]|nr:type II secretion system protein [Candidatus Berkelbacteria bacterium]
MIKTLQKRAFTLIELLVVIAIIGILASLIIVSLSGARSKATDTQLKNNIRNLNTALEQYATDNNTLYPGAAAGGVNINGGTVAQATGGTTCTTLATCLSGYVSGTTSPVFTGYTNAAKYTTNGIGTFGAFAAGAALTSTTGATIATGNGEYLATALGVVTPGNTASTGTLTAMGNNAHVWVVYGPQ